MAALSFRDPMGQGLFALLGTIIDPNTSQPVLSPIKYGAIFNPGAATQWGQVIHFEGDSHPWGSGGPQVGWRIDDTVTWLITCGFGPYETNDSNAQHLMNAAVDLISPVLHQHFQMPQSGQPTLPVPGVFSVLFGKDRSFVSRPYPNGHVYLLWHQPIFIKQQYSVELVIP
jgi:hypothetical protein